MTANTCKNIILYCICIFLFSVPAEAATICVYGTVTDSEGTAVPGATVSFIADDDTVATVSDPEGFYEAFLSDDPSGIHEDAAPAPYELFQNYPNPFNPSTTITYTLERSGPVRLDIYSVTGQRVRTLVDGVSGLGRNAVVWDGRDDAGRGVSAGVYLYRLRAGSQTVSKKMLLLDGGGSTGTMPQISAKAAVTAAEREYRVKAIKGIMYRSFDTTVSFDTQETELNIAFNERFQKYGLFLDSINIFNEFIIPGDTISVVLAEIHETLPEDGQITLVSQAGDKETVTVSGRNHYIRTSANCGYLFSEDCRRSSIASTSSSPVQGDGMLQVHAVNDTVFAQYVSTWNDTLSTYMPVVDSYETVTLWDITYAAWKDREWHVVGEGGWDTTDPNTILVQFKQTATESEIQAFTIDNELETTHISQYVEGEYSFLITQSIHAVEFLESHIDSSIIEYAQPHVFACVAD